MDYLLGIDVGTTGTKCLLIDPSGRIAARANHEYDLHTPKPGWSEQDPADWWQATREGLREILARPEIQADQIKGVGLSGQMHGSVFLDKDGKVIRPALLWNDQRTAAQCQWITDKLGAETVVAETRNPVLTGFTAPKIVWLQQQEPASYERVKKILLPKDYVRYLLTGEFATEVSDASGTSLLNIERRQWSGKMLSGLGLDREMLPKVFESPVASAAVCETGAKETGLRRGTPVVGGGGDQAAGAVGNGIVVSGLISATTGTSGVVFASMEEPRTDPELRTHTFCHAVPNKWHVMGVMLSAGGSLRWYRDAIATEEKAEAKRRGVDPYEVICESAEKAPVGCEGLIFLPYLTGERSPYPDANARGVFFGLTLRSDRSHLARAVLEGVAYGLRDQFEILKEMGLKVEQVRASGGGARSKLWRQIQADVLNCRLTTINVDEGPAFGAALLAGVGAGVYPTVEEACARTIEDRERTEPTAARSSLYERYYCVYRKLYASLRADFAAASGIAGSEP